MTATEPPLSDFEATLRIWRTAALLAAEAESEYTIAYGRAMAMADGKTEAIRHGQADLATETVRQKRDIARIEERSAKYRLEYLLRLAGSAHEAA